MGFGTFAMGWYDPLPPFGDASPMIPPHIFLCNRSPVIVRKHLIAIDGGMPDAGHASHARLALEAGRSETG